jgi:hypothetical protein
MFIVAGTGDPGLSKAAPISRRDHRSRLQQFRGRDLYDVVAWPDVQRRNPALPNPASGDRRECHLHGDEESLWPAGVKIEVLQNGECIAMMREFIANNPALWNEEIGI